MEGVKRRHRRKETQRREKNYPAENPKPSNPNKTKQDAETKQATEEQNASDLHREARGLNASNSRGRAPEAITRTETSERERIDI